jgi:hypothetical protein
MHKYTLRRHAHLQATKISAQPKLTNKYAYPIPQMKDIALVVTAPKRNGGGSVNTSIEQLINFGGCGQFSVPKQSLLLAASR